MKKLKYTLYIICVLCTLSCVKDKLPSGGQLAGIPYHLSVGQGTLTFGASTDLSTTINISSRNVSWKITGAPEWITLSHSSGTGSAVVNVTAKENSQISSTRAAVLTVSSATPDYQYQKNISVSQRAADIRLTVDRTSLSFAPQASAATVAVDANIEWEATTSATWITLDKENDTALKIAASENVTGNSRTATVTLRRVGTTTALATIGVQQSKGGVTGSTKEITFDIDGGTKSVEIDAQVTWSAVSSAPWLAVTPERGAAGKAELKITALANNSTSARSGYVYVKIGTTQNLSIPVSQTGISFKVDGSLQEFAATGGEAQKLTVISNKEWKVLSSPEWLTVTPGEGVKGTTDIALKAGENRSLNSRSATLRIGIDGISVYKDITVAQSGLDSEFNENTLEFTWETSQKEIEIVVPNSWSAMASGDWFSLSQYSGNGGEKVSVAVQTNDSEDARSGTLTIVTDGRTLNITVLQQGQYLKVSSTAGEVSAMGGSVNLSITTTVGAKDSIAYEGEANGWLDAKDDGKCNYTLTAAYNPSINSRVAQFFIKPTMNTTNNGCTQGVKFTVTQAGRAISASTSDINMFKEGGTSATYTITADGSYSISKPDSDHWYVLQHDAKSCTFYVVVSKNTTNDQRTSQLTISLDGLPDGEEKSLVIGIVQYAGDTNLDVEVDGWGDEQDWSASGELNGHEWIDLGLPSGLKWATCNVGATNPEEYGGYYAWGETEEKSNYDWKTYKWCNGSSTTMTKYCTDSGYGTVDNKRVLDPADDVAHVKWGGSWRMPTVDEIDELCRECNWQRTSLNGIYGYRVTGPNGNSIFLPAAGSRYDTELYNRGARGYYWSSSLTDYYCCGACYLSFYDDNYYRYYGYRYHGRSVRPVSK